MFIFLLKCFTITCIIQWTSASSQVKNPHPLKRKYDELLNSYGNVSFVEENNEIVQASNKNTEFVIKQKDFKTNSANANVEDNFSSIWTFRCDENTGCVRELKNKDEEPVEVEVCWLTCGKSGPLWPYPVKTTLGKCIVPFQLQSIAFGKSSAAGSNEAQNILYKMRDKFILTLQKMIPTHGGEQSDLGSELPEQLISNNISIDILVSEGNAKLVLDTNEAYSLSITSEDDKECTIKTDKQLDIQITATTIFGARHALETLSQLMTYDLTKKCFQILSNAEVNDAPAFPYRGLLMDTARNFIPVSDLKRMIDAMSYNKLNVFHWHITDSNSFPFFSKRVPQMTQYGAYSNSKIYYPEDIKELVEYAIISGVKIIPELDTPAHAGNGWQFGPSESLGDLALCVNLKNWRQYSGQPPTGQLNPINPSTYSILEKIYKDMLEAFGCEDIFHMGGDEVNYDCWKTEPLISSWIKQGQTVDFMEIWGFFQQEALKRLIRANKGKSLKTIVWTSGMTQSSAGRKFLNSSQYIIQVWEDGRSPVIQHLIQEKYQLIISNVDALYLDHGAGTWLGKEHVYEYKVWQVQYDNHLKKFISDIDKDKKKIITERQILGAEVTLWSEKTMVLTEWSKENLVNSQNMDTKTWPRGGAVAENLWSDPNGRSPLVYSRLNHHNRRMIQRGIHSDQLQPESCYQLSGHCDDPQSHI